MPRSLGARQADTIQQRARWFCYKSDYLGYCRVYLPVDVLQAYRGYVEHENHLRNQMREHRFAGGSLRSWRRAFFLDPQLRPTRALVIDLQYIRGSFSNEWYWPKAPHESAEAADANRGLVKQLIDQFAGDIHPDEGHLRRTGPQRHGLVSGASLRTVYEEFFTKFTVSRPTDSTRFTGLLLQIGRYLDQHPEATCTIYQMSNGTSRMRSVDDDEIPTLFQGANYDRSTDPPVKIYPGDDQIRRADELTIQIHTLQVQKNRDVIADNVPAIAVWVPKVMAGHWVSQPQGQ